MLVASTGVIGQQLPIETLKEGVKNLVPVLSDSREAGILAAQSIMTTDTVKKECAVEIELSGVRLPLGVCARVQV